MVSPPSPSPIDDNVEVLLGITLAQRLLSILLMLKSYVPTTDPRIPKINLEYWPSYEDFKECMKPVKPLSILLESSPEPMIYIILNYFLRLLYEVFDTSTRRCCSLHCIHYFYGHV